MASNDHVSLEFGEESDTGRNKVRKPVAVFFHLIFRVLAILAYLLCGIFSSGFVSNFVIIVVLLSLDFWTTKNITGRLLAGLRWWNYVDEDGKSHWVFESRKGQNSQSAGGAESRMFWLSLVGSVVAWCILFFVALITFNFPWLMVAGVGVTLNGANMYGYVRCRMGSGTNIKNAATQFLGRQALASMFSGMTSSNNTQQSQPSTL